MDMNQSNFWRSRRALGWPRRPDLRRSLRRHPRPAVPQQGAFGSLTATDPDQRLALELLALGASPNVITALTQGRITPTELETLRGALRQSELGHAGFTPRPPSRACLVLGSELP
jgi:hypothetical protein